MMSGHRNPLNLFLLRYPNISFFPRNDDEPSLTRTPSRIYLSAADGIQRLLDDVVSQRLGLARGTGDKEAPPFPKSVPGVLVQW